MNTKHTAEQVEALVVALDKCHEQLAIWYNRANGKRGQKKADRYPHTATALVMGGKALCGVQGTATRIAHDDREMDKAIADLIAKATNQ